MSALQRLAILFVMSSILLLGGGIGWALGNNSILSFMLLGSFFISLSTLPTRRELLSVLALAALFRAVYSVWFEFHPYFLSAFISWGSFLGLASLAVLLVQTLRSRGERRAFLRTTFLTAGALPYSWLLLAFCLSFVTRTSRTYDPLLLAFDSSLGRPISFVFGRVLATHSGLRHLTKAVYDALPLGASCILAWNNRSRFRPVSVIPMYISMMVLGYGLYWLYPAAGPAFAYRGLFPFSAPDPRAILGMTLPPFNAPRNAMPSLHFGAMLLLMWNSRAWPLPARALAAIFSAGIAFATLALGEHYLIDLIVAFPFMLALQAGWCTAVPLQSPARYQPLAAGICATAGWLVALRWAIPAFQAATALSWSAVLATVAATLLLERRLAREACSCAVTVPATSPCEVAADATAIPA